MKSHGFENQLIKIRVGYINEKHSPCLGAVTSALICPTVVLRS